MRTAIEIYLILGELAALASLQTQRGQQQLLKGKQCGPVLLFAIFLLVLPFWLIFVVRGVRQ